MTADERAQIVVTARLLRATASIQWLPVGITIIAAAAAARGQGVSAAIAAIVLGLVAIYFGVRVSFDARLFDDIATGRLTTLQLDTALGTLRKGKGGRGWADRCRGARRLVAFCAIATMAQIIAVVPIGWL
ncbi:MAG TPA: hypothetical protein VNN08_11560 [Thermoanaerobaculia bacterium]|nr:hypothetical protein [Thermoanaerobaculia bacterium]